GDAGPDGGAAPGGAAGAAASFARARAGRPARRALRYRRRRALPLRSRRELHHRAEHPGERRDVFWGTAPPAPEQTPNAAFLACEESPRPEECNNTERERDADSSAVGSLSRFLLFQ